MFEPPTKQTFAGIAAEEWEALSHGIDGALDGDQSWQLSLSLLKEVSPDAYNTCVAEIHYYRFGFSCCRYIQNHWAGITASITAALAGIAWMITTNYKGAC